MMIACKSVVKSKIQLKNIVPSCLGKMLAKHEILQSYITKRNMHSCKSSQQTRVRVPALHTTQTSVTARRIGLTPQSCNVLQTYFFI